MTLVIFSKTETMVEKSESQHVMGSVREAAERRLHSLITEHPNEPIDRSALQK